MRVLILSASTGGGHMRASSAIKSYILNNEQDAVVEIIDTLQYISPILSKTISEGYEKLAKKIPKVYGAMYKTTNKKNLFNSSVFAFNSQFSRRLMPLMNQFKPDIIITTHPFSTEMVSKLKSSGKISIPIICVMTDYAPHRTWINKNISAYIVANDGMVDIMCEMGVQRDIIYPFGIPIEDTFYSEKNKKDLLKQLGLRVNVPTILIMAGSFGVTDILKIYANISRINMDFQIIVITGRNKKLYSSFEKMLNNEPKNVLVNKILGSRNIILRNHLSIKERKDTKLIFFTNEVHKYMQISDLIITKPGGLTVSEALACNLPMAIFDAIPGQEEENAEFLIDNNMAVRIEKGISCERTIMELLEQNEKFKSMKVSCKSFDKSNSMQNIFELIKKLIND